MCHLQKSHKLECLQRGCIRNDQDKHLELLKVKPGLDLYSSETIIVWHRKIIIGLQKYYSVVECKLHPRKSQVQVVPQP